MAMEKLGVEKQELVSELQADYNRLRQQQMELRKTAASSAEIAQKQNEMEQIKARLNELQSPSYGS